MRSWPSRGAACSHSNFCVFVTFFALFYFCLQIIRLSGYASDEKLAIARRYLEPQAAKDAGVPEGAVHLDDEAMHTLINEYYSSVHTVFFCVAAGSTACA